MILGIDDEPRARRWRIRAGGLRWLPNVLSVMRLVLVPVYLLVAFQIVATLRSGEPVLPVRASAVAVLLVSGATDVLDGFLARRWEIQSAAGAVIDAVADKLTQVTALAFLTLVGPPAFPRLPLWLLGAVLLRDLVLGLGWLALRKRPGGVPVEHAFHGRLATVLVFVVIVAATAGADRAMLAPAVTVAALAALASTGGYAVRAGKLLSGRGEAAGPAG